MVLKSRGSPVSISIDMLRDLSAAPTEGENTRVVAYGPFSSPVNSRLWGTVNRYVDGPIEYNDSLALTVRYGISESGVHDLNHDASFI
jgi:hypothetical protein